jgi:hypothetical protein
MRAQTEVTDWLSVWGGLSRTFRYPTVQELSWIDSTVVRVGLPRKENHALSELGLRIKNGTLSISLRGFRRVVDDAIVLAQAEIPGTASSQKVMLFPQVELKGAAAGLSIQVWRIGLSGTLAYTDYRQQGRSALPFPRFSSISELSYRDIFGDHVVDLKVAARLRAVSRHYGLEFVPSLSSFAQQNSVLMPGFSSLDLYTVAKIGDAYVTFVSENPFNVNRMTVPYYPLLGRNIKLGVNWIFTD